MPRNRLEQIPHHLGLAVVHQAEAKADTWSELNDVAIGEQRPPHQLARDGCPVAAAAVDDLVAIAEWLNDGVNATHAFIVDANTPGISDADGEVMLDIEVSAAIAPGSRIVVYFGTDTHYYVRLDEGQEFIVRQQNQRGVDTSFETGMPVGIAVNEDAAQVLKD